MVSCTSMAWAMATLVPTPSVLVASTGRVMPRQRGGVEHAGEAAEAAEHLGPLGAGHRRLHQLDRPVARLDVDPGGGVGDRVRR